jgi:hypothetical protein
MFRLSCSRRLNAYIASFSLNIRLGWSPVRPRPCRARTTVPPPPPYDVYSSQGRLYAIRSLISCGLWLIKTLCRPTSHATGPSAPASEAGLAPQSRRECRQGTALGLGLSTNTRAPKSVVARACPIRFICGTTTTHVGKHARAYCKA